MRKATAARFVALLLMLDIGNALATQASVPFFECRNCSDAQMQQAAFLRAGTGVRIVYNLASAHIFQYYVHVEPGCRDGLSDTDSADPKPRECREGPARRIESMPLDLQVRAPFGALLGLYRSGSKLLHGGRTRIDITEVGADPRPPLRALAFDPRQVIYERTSGGAFHQFMDAVAEFANDPGALHRSDPALAALMVDIVAPIGNIVIPLVAAPLDMQTLPTAIRVEFAGPDGSCARIEFSYDRQAPGAEHYRARFLTAVDSTGVPLPTYEQVHAPGFHRGFHGPGARENAIRMGKFLQRNGLAFADPPDSCRQYRLTCTSDDRLHGACALHCIP